MADIENIVENLKQLRKNLGVRRHDLDERLTPEFREFIDASGDEFDTLRQKLTTYLDGLLVGLQGEHQIAAGYGLNLVPGVEHDMLTRRIEKLAHELHCDMRTARRRMDDAFRQMAEIAVRGGEGPAGRGLGGHGWYVESFEVVLRLDRDTPIAYERHRIKVTADELDRVITTIDVPASADHDGDQVGLQTDVWFGGLLAGVAKTKGSRTHFSSTIQLPRPLSKGDVHTLGIISRIPPGQPMLPRYVCVPHRHCRHFALTVRFDPKRPPALVWKHDGVPHSVVVGGEPADDELRLDRAFEVHAKFNDLTWGGCYGIQWRVR